MLSSLELELTRLRLGDEGRLGHNFSAILSLSESLPDVVIIIATLGGEEGVISDVLDLLCRGSFKYRIAGI